jgi:hypothetical protein
MKTKTAVIIIATVAIIFGIFYFYPCNCTPVVVDNKNIKVYSPSANMVVHSPFVVTGEAVGNWFFEASFPVVLMDSNGKVIAQSPAKTKSDWMTTKMIPFESTLKFGTTTSTGTLVLKKDNPSGLPANDDSISIPVRFK